ncbi:MAG: VOC family protein [Chloroflexi bacterium]|nr:VOC family protein [Chloroflexota bacterium]
MDVEGVIDELAKAEGLWTGLDAKTVIGHIHLHVADIDKAEAFYHGVLGFDKMMDYGPSAGFVSAGGYHHHIGYNTWAGVGAPPAPADAVGLRHFEIRLPNTAELDKVAHRVREAGLQGEEAQGGWLVRDPSQNGVMLIAPAAGEENLSSHDKVRLTGGD